MNNSDAFDMQARAREHLTKAQNFQNMGMAAAAENELNQARQLDPTIVADPGYQSLSTQKAAQSARTAAMKFPMWTAAGVLIVDAIVNLLLWLINLASGVTDSLIFWMPVHIIVDIILAVGLFRLNETSKRTTVWWAVVGLVLGAITSFTSLSWLDLILQISYSGSLLLLLVGNASKIRAGLGIAVFSIGYLGTICLLFLFSFLAGLG